MPGTFKLSDTNLYFYKDNNAKDELIHYKLLEEIFDFMRTRKFKIENDLETLKDFPSIADDYFYGRKGDLEFKSNRYPTGFEITFYQSINTEHKAGGFYDFRKLEKMPYILKLMFINETNKIIKILADKGYKNETSIKCKSAEDKIIQFCREKHFDKPPIEFKLSDLDGTTNKYDFNNQDRDKKTIHNGEIKYFKDYKGYLMRGKVYHNINNMWWVILNDSDYRNIAAFDLFDLNDEDIKGKQKKIKRYMNPKNIEHNNQEYRIGDNIFIFNCRTGLFKANTDYGNYQYCWSGGDNYKEFLSNLNKDYFLDKMSYGKELMEVDYEATIKSWKEKIIEMRKDNYDRDKFDKDEARELWNFINEELDDSMSCETLQRLTYDKCGDLGIEEPWYEFETFKKYKDDVEKFYNLFCKFQEVLRKELVSNE